MEVYQLDKSIHALMTDSENKIMIENNQLVLVDTIKKTIFSVPITPEVLTFFNITTVDLVKAGFLDPSSSTCISSETATSASICAVQSSIIENSPTESNILQSNILSKNNVQGTASWKDPAAVKTLIAQWKERQNLGLFQSTTIRNDTVWKMIADTLATLNIKWIYSAQQCKDKFKEIRKQYVKTKDHNRQSGLMMISMILRRVMTIKVTQR